MYDMSRKNTVDLRVAFHSSGVMCHSSGRHSSSSHVSHITSVIVLQPMPSIT